MAIYDMHMCSRPKQYVETIDIADSTVQDFYLGARRMSSVATWFWVLDDNEVRLIVAEGWAHWRKHGLWLRIAKIPVRIGE